MAIPVEKKAGDPEGTENTKEILQYIGETAKNLNISGQSSAGSMGENPLQALDFGALNDYIRPYGYEKIKPE